MSDNKWGATFSGGEDAERDDYAEETPPRGMEIDVRPHPALRENGGATRNLGDLAARIRAAQAEDASPELKASMWPDANTTGAFISAAASIRHEVKPYRWWQAAGSMLVLYLAVIGVPLGLIAFAVYEILHRR